MLAGEQKIRHFVSETFWQRAWKPEPNVWIESKKKLKWKYRATNALESLSASACSDVTQLQASKPYAGDTAQGSLARVLQVHIIPGHGPHLSTLND